MVDWVLDNWLEQKEQTDRILKAKTSEIGGLRLYEKPLGNDLLSQEVALQVPSALTGLTTGFGMGPGVPLPLKSPRDVFTM